MNPNKYRSVYPIKNKRYNNWAKRLQIYSFEYKIWEGWINLNKSVITQWKVAVTLGSIGFTYLLLSRLLNIHSRSPRFRLLRNNVMYQFWRTFFVIERQYRVSGTFLTEFWQFSYAVICQIDIWKFTRDRWNLALTLYPCQSRG